MLSCRVSFIFFVLSRYDHVEIGELEMMYRTYS